MGCCKIRHQLFWGGNPWSRAMTDIFRISPSLSANWVQALPTALLHPQSHTSGQLGVINLQPTLYISSFFTFVEFRTLPLAACNIYSPFWPHSQELCDQINRAQEQKVGSHESLEARIRLGCVSVWGRILLNKRHDPEILYIVNIYI